MRDLAALIALVCVFAFAYFTLKLFVFPAGNNYPSDDTDYWDDH